MACSVRYSCSGAKYAHRVVEVEVISIFLADGKVGEGLLEGFGGRAVHLVHAADQSAGRLVALITATFPGFRDHCVYK